MTDATEAYIIKSSSAENPTEAAHGETFGLKRNSAENITTWKKHLSRDEIKRIYKISNSVAPLFYSAKELTATMLLFYALKLAHSFDILLEYFPICQDYPLLQ